MLPDDAPPDGRIPCDCPTPSGDHVRGFRAAARGVSAYLSLFLLAGACNTDDTTAPIPRANGSFTVDASTGWVYVSLEDSAVVTPVPSAVESTTWDIAFFSTNVTLNGGEAGPGGVRGYCVCQNSASDPSNDEWLAMTAVGESADFDTLGAVPPGAEFVADALTPAIAAWYSGFGDAAIANPDAVHFVRLSDSSGVAKMRVTALSGATASTAGAVTLEYAVAAHGAPAFEASQTVTLDLSAGARAFDFQTGQTTNDAAAWDVRLDGFSILVNGGVSGPGKGAAARITGTTFGAATPDATAPNAFRTDVYAGVFATSRYYRYNLAGDNRITPTFDVYLLRRGTRVYKLQITNYYSATGQPRHITFRYAQIAG